MSLTQKLTSAVGAAIIGASAANATACPPLPSESYLAKQKKVYDQMRNINKISPDKETRVIVYNTSDGGRIMQLKFDNKTYVVGFDHDRKNPWDTGRAFDGYKWKCIGGGTNFDIPKQWYNPKKSF